MAIQSDVETCALRMAVSHLEHGHCLLIGKGRMTTTEAFEFLLVETIQSGEEVGLFGMGTGSKGHSGTGHDVIGES